MTGPEHYEEAERLLREAEPKGGGSHLVVPWQEDRLAAAQVHATLALAAATAAPLAEKEPLGVDKGRSDKPYWFEVLG